jgi:hypothetical protein
MQDQLWVTEAQPYVRPPNEDLLRQTGFTQVDTLWSYLNFRAWIAFKN